MKKCIIILLIILLLTMCACQSNPDESTDVSGAVKREPDEVIEIAMETLISGSVNEPVFLGIDGTPTVISGNTGLAGSITSRISYEVISLEISGDTGVATLEITAPDAAALVYQALEGMDEFDEGTFLANMEAMLASAETRSYNVEVELNQVDGQWLFVLNADFSNAITGGMLQEYASVRQQILESVLEGGE